MKKTDILLPFGLVIAFLFIYSFRILQFPIFEDEAELLFFAEMIIDDPLKNLFVSMQYGPLPALGWLVSVFGIVFRDTLLGGRMLNVIFASTLIYWTFLVGRLYRLPKRFFIFASLFLTFSPMLLVNSRVALWDTSVVVFSAWYIYFFLLALKKPKFSTLVTFSVLLIFSFLIKFTSFFAIPGLMILLGVKFFKKINRMALIRILATILISTLIFILIVFLPNTQVVRDAASSFITSSSPQSLFGEINDNIWLYLNWFVAYYPRYPLYLIAFAYVLTRYRKEKVPDVVTILLIWFVVSSFMMVAFNRFFYPRHLLSMVLPLAVIAAYALTKVPIVLSSTLAVLFILLRLPLFYDILFNYSKADIAKEDRFQYFEDYTSGVNLAAISQTLVKVSEGKPTVVWLDGTWVMEYGLRRELRNHNNIVFKSFVVHNGVEFAPPRTVAKDSQGENYVLVNRRQPPNLKSFKLVKSFPLQQYKYQYLYFID